MTHAEVGHHRTGDRNVALFIAILAAMLAFAEMLAKSAQTSALGSNIEAANLWSFYQAKTIRQTVVRTAVELVDAERAALASPEARTSLEQRIGSWKETIARYDSEPSTQEGRKELMARATEAEKRRDRSLAAYHHYEVASAALEIAVVLASAEIISGAVFLLGISGLLGLAGIGLCVLGFVAPNVLHLF